MATWNKRIRKLATVAGLAGMGLAGCGKTPAPGDPNAGSSMEHSATSPPSAETGAETVHVALKPGAAFNQSFSDSVITEVLEGHQLPPDRTYAGKKTGPLRVEIESLWPRIKLTDGANQPASFTLSVETSAGPFEITLQPELAPNHVRNMLILAKLGYYDGLLFERNIHQEIDNDGEKSRLDMLIGGCPTGTGDDGFGHLGYFLRAEPQPDVKHGEGAVGFWHEEDPNSAGCRFYITLNAAPVLDGNFTVIGHVNKGLDVLRQIAAQPVIGADPESPDHEKPVRPVVIKKMTIQKVENGE